MKYAAINDRLADLGGAKWAVHFRARDLARAGRDVIELTIGEPDSPTPQSLIDTATRAMQAGRTAYSDGQGELGLRQALARRYTASTGRTIAPDQVLCLPGTQTALFATMLGLVDSGDEVLVGDPHYATYEGVIRAADATMVPVPLNPETGFRIQARDIAARITPRSRAILLNTPHNPTGAVLSRDEIAQIGQVARDHDLWIISDEVYEELIFDGTPFASPLSDPDLAERTVVVSSISKSHAAPGFRSGWAIGSAEFAARLLPLCETMLFGNQPFIADMTEAALAAPSQVARDMASRFSDRAQRLARIIGTDAPLRVHVPQAGMFALIDIRGLDMNSDAYAFDLLEETGVAVMPGSAFGQEINGWVRVALTVPDDLFDMAAQHIRDHALTRPRTAAP